MGLLNFDAVLETDRTIGDKMLSVTTGTVKENWDSKHPGMIKVEILLGEAGKNLSGWVPVASSYCGKEFGFYSLPEIGSEVIIAFNMGDRNCPIVIGCLWNNVSKLPEKTAVEKNTIKRFKTKGGCEVVFNEESGKEVIEVNTPGKLTIKLEDEKKTITVQDEKGENGIVINAKDGKVSVNAKSKMEFNVNKKPMLTLDGQGKTATLKSDNIKLEATQSVSLKGQNDKIDSGMLEIKAKSSLKVESSGVAQIKGAMLKLN